MKTPQDYFSEMNAERNIAWNEFTTIRDGLRRAAKGKEGRAAANKIIAKEKRKFNRISIKLYDEMIENIKAYHADAEMAA